MLTQGGAEVDRGRGFPATALLVARQKLNAGCASQHIVFGYTLRPAAGTRGIYTCSQASGLLIRRLALDSEGRTKLTTGNPD